MRQYQGNSFFLLPTTLKLHNSIEKASKDTQPLYITKSFREARKNIIASVDHILQHDLVQENPIEADFVSIMEKKMQNLKERFNTKMILIYGQRMAKTINCVIHHSKINNRELLIRDSRDMEDRIKSCYNWKKNVYTTLIEIAMK
jgi:hypothetical protein